MILLEATNVKLYVQDRLLLDLEHIQIQQHDRIGLVGRNGSGKTTLLEVLRGKKTTTAGNIASDARVELLPQLKHTKTTKSGGEVTQEYINHALSRKPDILLADEPTTNLDSVHIVKLEKQLKRSQGAIVIVSHDRAFLDSLCTVIWELQDGKIKEYKGSYSDYVAQKKMERRQHENAYEQYVKKKHQLEEALVLKEQKAERATKKPKKVSASEAKITGAKPYFANKQKKLRKAAKAIETRLEKLEEVEKVKEVPSVKMKLPNEETFKARVVLRVDEMEGAIGDRVLWKSASFAIRGGDKIAILGQNGVGKTTLIRKIMTGAERVTVSPSVKLGYFSQNLDVLNTEKSILQNVRSTSNQDETFIRTVLARLRFFRDDGCL